MQRLYGNVIHLNKPVYTKVFQIPWTVSLGTLPNIITHFSDFIISRPIFRNSQTVSIDTHMNVVHCIFNLALGRFIEICRYFGPFQMILRDKVNICFSTSFLHDLLFNATLKTNSIGDQFPANKSVDSMQIFGTVNWMQIHIRTGVARFTVPHKVDTETMRNQMTHALIWICRQLSAHIQGDNDFFFVKSVILFCCNVVSRMSCVWSHDIAKEAYSNLRKPDLSIVSGARTWQWNEKNLIHN